MKLLEKLAKDHYGSVGLDPGEYQGFIAGFLKAREMALSIALIEQGWTDDRVPMEMISGYNTCATVIGTKILSLGEEEV